MLWADLPPPPRAGHCHQQPQRVPNHMCRGLRGRLPAPLAPGLLRYAPGDRCRFHTSSLQAGRVLSLRPTVLHPGAGGPGGTACPSPQRGGGSLCQGLGSGGTAWVQSAVRVAPALGPPPVRPGQSPVTLPAELEGPVSSVRLSPDGLRVLSTTSSGLLGFLDVASREYRVLARSHTAPVLALAAECSRGQLATVSQDCTVRIWDQATLQQVGCGQEGAGGGGGAGERGTRGPWWPGPGCCVPVFGA